MENIEQKINIKKKTIKVYARINENREVVKILSTQFDEILDSDIFIDEGEGDDYVYPHIRFNILNFAMQYRYKIIDKKTKSGEKSYEMVLVNE